MNIQVIRMSNAEREMCDSEYMKIIPKLTF